MAREKPLLDNLRYLFCKDASTGKQAGFNVQAVRDRLTEIQYDLDHIQGDIDQIINGDLSTIYEDIKDINQRIENLKQQFNEFKVQIKQELDNFKVEIRKELNAAISALEEKLKQTNERIDNLSADLDEVKRTYEHFPTGTRLLFYQKSAPPGWSVVQGLDDALLRVSTVKGGELVTGASFEQVFKFQDVGAGGEHDVSGQTSSVTVGVASTTASTSLTESQMPRHKHNGSMTIDKDALGPSSMLTPDTGVMHPDDGRFGSWRQDYMGGMFDGGAYFATIAGTQKGMCYTLGSLAKSQGGTSGNPTLIQSKGPGVAFRKMGALSSAEAGGGAGHAHAYSFDAGSHSHSFNQHINAHTHSIDLTIKNISVIVCQKEVVF